MADIRACLDAVPPLPQIAANGGAVVTANYLGQAGIRSADFVDRCSADGFTIKHNTNEGTYTISK